MRRVIFAPFCAAIMVGLTFAQSLKETVTMRNVTRLIETGSLPAIIIYLPVPEAADAYLDPGTGSIILQVAIGGLVGGLLAAKIYWNRIRRLLKTLFSRGTKGETADE